MRRLILCALLLAACDDDNSSKSTPDSGANNQPPSMVQDSGAPHDGSVVRPEDAAIPTTAKVRVLPNIVAGVSQTASEGHALRIGSPLATDLKSLKYYITSIVLCEELEIQGTGFSGSRGCVPIYENMPAGAPDYNSYMVTQAQADTSPDHFVDLMTSEGRATLRQPISVELPISERATSDADGGASDEDAGAPPERRGLRYGLINFYRPIKVKAQFPLLDGSNYIRTRAVTRVNTDPSDGPGGQTQRVEIGDSLSGPTEETTYMLNNGGAFFVFQQPFVVTQAEAAAGVTINVDLVFNPDSFGQAHDQANCRNEPFVAICDPTNDIMIDMPYVRMSPVPRKQGEKTRKETYLLSYDTGSKLRIELYYNDADPEAGIQGVDTAIIYDESATHSVNNVIASNFVAQTGRVTRSDASVTLEDYRHMPNLTGLRRRQDGTATIHCLFTGSLCPTLGGSVPRAYTYEGDSLVSSD